MMRSFVLPAMFCGMLLFTDAAISQSASGAAASDIQRTRLRELNQRLATTLPTTINGNAAAITVAEVRQQSDLNGDGDMIDLVMHIFDATTGRVRNLGVSVGSDPIGAPSIGNGGWLQGRVLPIFASEESGDLNADGDTDDTVLHVYDTERDSLLNLRLAPDSQLTMFDGRRLVFLVNEALQGQRDLNQDRDSADRVLYFFDVVTGRVENTGLAAMDFGADMIFNPQELTSDPILFTVGEQAQGGIDLNGDGDTTDRRVLHVLDKGRVSNLRVDVVAPRSFVPPQAGAGVALAAVQEQVDLNGDGDTGDAVLQIVDIASGDTRNTGLAVEAFGPALVFDRERGLALINVRELAQGKDFNGDGRLDGGAVHVVSTRTGQVRNLQLNLIPLFAAEGRAVLFAQESDVNSDLNDDADQGDIVMVLADLDNAVPRLVSTRLALGFADLGVPFDPSPFQFRDGQLTFLVSELSQGNRDLNADGDTNDSVLHFVDLRTFAVRNSRLDGSFAYRTVLAPALPFSAGRAVVPVQESRQGRDLNNDGDANDIVMQILDAKSGSVSNTGIAVAVETFFPFDVPLMIRGESFVSFLVQEERADLNADGDTFDRVHHLLDIASGTITNVGKAALAAVPFARSDLGFGFAGLTDSFGLETEIFGWARFNGLRPDTDGPGLGDAFTFMVSEAAQGNVDLNGDGDSDDVVVHATRLADRDRNGRLDFAE